MRVQIITFQLQNMSFREYQQMADELAPVFASLDGLLWKTWIANEEQNTYGGIYIWERQADMERYLESDLISQVRDSPRIMNFVSTDYEVMAAPTRVTGGFSTAPA